MTQEQLYIDSQLKKFNITDAAISKMTAEFSVLKIENFDDKEGYEQVKEARLAVKLRNAHVNYI